MKAYIHTTKPYERSVTECLCCNVVHCSLYIDRLLETELGLDAGSLYGVRDTVAAMLAECIKENGLDRLHGSPAPFKKKENRRGSLGGGGGG